jgi:dGTPase
MKYPVGSDKTNKESAATKKYGFFASEQSIAELALKEVGLDIGKRHALAYIMEACDDIAYVVMDIEDAVKKGLASFSDLAAYLQHSAPDDEMVKIVVKESSEKHEEYRKSIYSLSPSELNDVSMQRFRVAAIGAMMREATQTFVDNAAEFIGGTSTKGLMERSNAEQLRKLLKDFGLKHAYTHRSVLIVELQGYNVLRSLMDMFWAAIVDRKNCDEPKSVRRHPFTKFVYGRISENYRRVFENPSKDSKLLPMRYRECQLLTDMVSGMTDSFAMDLCKELQSLKGDFEPHKFLSKESGFN